MACASLTPSARKSDKTRFSVSCDKAQPALSKLSLSKDAILEPQSDLRMQRICTQRQLGKDTLPDHAHLLPSILAFEPALHTIYCSTALAVSVGTDGVGKATLLTALAWVLHARCVVTPNDSHDAASWNLGSRQASRNSA
jgi:Mrp family chromosome partitioning ATPase